MSTANISLGGIFILGDPLAYPEIKPDMLLDLVIFSTDDENLDDVCIEAKVARIAKEGEGESKQQGFGLQFETVTDQQTQSLEKLIHTLVD